MKTNLSNYLLIALTIFLSLAFTNSASFAVQDSEPKQEKKEEAEKDQDKDKAEDQDKDKAEDQDKDKAEDQDKDKAEDQDKDNADEKDGAEKDSGDKDDAKQEDETPDEQSRTGTQQLGRLLKLSRSSDEMMATFKPVASSAAASTVSVFSGDDQVALGTIISRDGFILTKASELDDKLSIWASGKKYAATVHGIHKRTDLAMLKIDAEELTPANLSPVPLPQLGSWLVSPGPGEDPFSLGVVAVQARKIGSASAFVGIMPVDITDDEGNKLDQGVRIQSVTADAPSDKAGLRVNDVITMIDSSPTKNPDELRSVLSLHEPGDRIELTVKRGEKTMTLAIELADRNSFLNNNSQFERTNQQNRMGSKLSKRRRNYPLVFQHDSGLNANQCGGPIVDLSGQIIGINISRAERVSSLALPVEAVISVIAELKSGELSPAVVNKNRIEEIDREIADSQEKLQGLPDKRFDLELDYEVKEARREEISKMIEELQTRLSELDENGDAKKKELSELKKDIFTFKRKIKKLQAEQDGLRNGFEK